MASAKQLFVPAFVKSAPQDCFVGISPPMPSLSVARTAAVADAARKILRDIGGHYNYGYIDRTSGNVHNPHRTVIDQLSVQSSGFIQDLEKHIVQTQWIRDSSNGYVCFVLVRYPDGLIKKMVRLSRGAKIHAAVLHRHNSKMVFMLSEINGVSVVMTSATIQIHKLNRFAKVISFYIWQVPEGTKNIKSVSFPPVWLCRNSTTIQLKLDLLKKELNDYFLGAKLEHSVMFEGIDEIGRPVRTSVSF